MNVFTAEMLLSAGTLFFAYLVIITISGSFRAWVAHKMGDDTGVMLGFLSLNPMVHVDPIGLLALLIFGFGWGRTVPINPYNIKRSYRTLRLMAAYLSDTVAYFAMAFVALIALVLSFGPKVLVCSAPSMVVGIISPAIFEATFPESSSVAISCALIGVAFIYLSVLLGVLYGIVNSFYLAAMLILVDNKFFTRHRDLISLLVPLLLILFLGYYIRIWVIIGICSVGIGLAHLFGIA